MITLYHCVSARSFRPLWLLEELGLPFQLKMLPFPPRGLARQFLQENPLGTVPLLIDSDTRMSESAAICEYLAARHSPGVLDVGLDEPAERKQPQVADDYSRWFLARLRAVDAVLQGNEFLCAGRFTAADVAVGYALMLAGHLNLDAQFPPAVAAYWQRLQLRPAFQRAMAIQHQAALDQGVPTTPAPDIRPN